MLRKRVKRLDIERRIKHIELRLNQLECPHESTQFVAIPSLLACGVAGRHERCCSCGKVLRRFNTEKEYLEAELEHHSGQCEEEAVRIKARLAELA